MQMNPKELVKALRRCANGESEECPFTERGVCGCPEMSADQIERDQKEIAELREKKRWILVSEKAPEYDMPQLAMTADGEVLIANYAYGEWFDTWGQDVDVTYWMPLPDAPKEDNHDA